MKPTLNEQLARMQKIAGIIKENQVNEARTYYHVLEDGGYGNIGHQGVYDTKEEAQELADKVASGFVKNYGTKLPTEDELNEFLRPFGMYGHSEG